jgi:hypothetical protein
MTLAHNLSKCFYVSVVIHSFFRFQPFPCNMKTYNIHSPVFEVVEVLVSEAMVRGILEEIGMKRLQFVNNIDSVIDSISSKLVYKERTISINFNESGQKEEVKNKKS